MCQRFESFIAPALVLSIARQSDDESADHGSDANHSPFSNDFSAEAALLDCFSRTVGYSAAAAPGEGAGPAAAAAAAAEAAVIGLGAFLSLPEAVPAASRAARGGAAAALAQAAVFSARSPEEADGAWRQSFMIKEPASLICRLICSLCLLQWCVPQLGMVLSSRFRRGEEGRSLRAGLLRRRPDARGRRRRRRGGGS